MALRGDPATNIIGVFYRNVGPETEYEGQVLGDMVRRILKYDIPVIAFPNPMTSLGNITEEQREKDELRGQELAFRAIREFEQASSK